MEKLSIGDMQLKGIKFIISETLGLAFSIGTAALVQEGNFYHFF